MIEFVAYYVNNNLYSNKEAFANKGQPSAVGSIFYLIFIVATLVLNLFIHIYAAYLSFNCNSGGIESSLFSKIFFTFFAFIFGLLYLIYYFLVNYMSKRCI